MDIKYAVENAHDENILTHELPLDKELYLSFMLSMLTLQPLTQDNLGLDEEMMRIRQKLLIYKHQVDALDCRDDDYYQKKEQLIYKIFCSLRGVSFLAHEQDHDLQESAQEYEE
ncbi:hypothetical protein KR093_004391 [Drosophila rubida]|uniref:Uncharacterized protein n=1 Tax=Drosophila rubida TaxID=30044 RepID=A0AAD4PM34_9MUSC|nr:hypothetical protein KR093_004391 [Drosophila rubida]